MVYFCAQCGANVYETVHICPSHQVRIAAALERIAEKMERPPMSENLSLACKDLLNAGAQRDKLAWTLRNICGEFGAGGEIEGRAYRAAHLRDLICGARTLLAELEAKP